MRFSDFNFIDTALRGKESRNDVMPIEQYNQILLTPSNRIGESVSYVNRFRSWCRFDRDIESYWLQNKNQWGSSSIKQYAGAHVFDYLFWDVDKADKNEQGVEIADLKTATELLAQLFEHVDKHYGLTFDDFVLWLSAGKGYHPYLKAGKFMPYPHDLNAAASGIFALSVLPEGWVRHHKLGGIIDPTTTKDANRLERQGGSMNFKEGREWNGFKVGCTKEMWEALQKDWRLYYEFAKEPTELYLSEDYLDGSAYWQTEPNQKLTELWKESLARAIVEKEGKKLSVPNNGTAANGGTSKASFFIPENLEMPQCIRQMHKEAHAGEFKSGSRHGALIVLAAFYSRLLPEEAVLAMLLALNARLSQPKPGDEVEKIVSDVFERGYRTGCGNPNSDLGQTCLAFCNAKASLEECPKHKVQSSELVAVRSSGAGTALHGMIERMKRGPSEITLGIDEWDQSVGEGHFPGELIVLCGYPQTGKTLLAMRIIRHQAEIAKKRGQFLLVFTPETDSETVAKIIVKQKGRMTTEEMYQHVGNGGLDPELIKWFEEMEDTLIFVKAASFTTDDIKRALDYHQKRLNRNAMTMVLDGVKFIRLGPSHAQRRIIRPDEEVAICLDGLCKDYNLIGVYNLHIAKADNEGDYKKKLHEQRPAANAGFGTQHYRDAAQYFWTVYRDNDNVIARIDKFRQNFDGSPPPDRIVFRYYGPHYMVYTQSEVDRLIRQHGLSYFGNDPGYLIPAGNFKLDLRAH